MHLNYTLNKPNIYTIWYIKCDSIVELWWENIHRNVSSYTVFLKDTLIQIKGKFP